ncbi:hypothetical protein ASB1_13500 [Helicobacter heilmannii]|nr:hypothetical protein ASB1_13500 [Helicobacter heilmannii]GMB94787.1 hypothetical protein NHP21011_08800 [Helicobacter heilmannii]
MDTKQHAKLVLLLDTLQKQLWHLQTECEATRVRLHSLCTQHAKKAQLTPPPSTHNIAIKKISDL